MIGAYFCPEIEITKQIESVRSKMNRLADELGIVHPQVMRCSQMLDELLLEYYTLTLGQPRSRHGQSK